MSKNEKFPEIELWGPPNIIESSVRTENSENALQKQVGSTLIFRRSRL
jgi:hypothetical protein